MRVRYLVQAAVLMLATGVAVADDATGLVEGRDDSQMRVLIVQIDDGKPLFSHSFQLSTRASLAPGPHNLVVWCEYTTASYKKTVPVRVSLVVEAGKTYDLDAHISDDRKWCVVTVK